MLNVKPLSQRDSRWSFIKLGNSNYTIGSHGCTLTALTAFINHVLGLNLTPGQVNTQLRKYGAFQGALIVWANVAKAYPKLKWVWRDYSYNNAVALDWVNARKTPILVEVDFDGSPRTDDKHWVLFLGDKKMLDPWTGKIVPTSNYKILTGMARFQKA